MFLTTNLELSFPFFTVSFTQFPVEVNTPAAGNGLLNLAAVAKYPHKCGNLACCLWK